MQSLILILLQNVEVCTDALYLQRLAPSSLIIRLNIENSVKHPYMSTNLCKSSRKFCLFLFTLRPYVEWTKFVRNTFAYSKK